MPRNDRDAREAMKQRIAATVKRLHKAGLSKRQIRRALNQGPEADALREYGAKLNLDWQAILKIIVQLLPLLLMFI